MASLVDMKQKKAEYEEKIEAYKSQISSTKEKIAILDKMIFELEDGRTLKAAKMAMEQNPEFAAMVRAMAERLEILSPSNPAVIENAIKKTRGRPAKAKATA
jgi:chromosome segregation ATPase